MATTSKRPATPIARLARDLRADLRALKKGGIDPRTFAGGHHAWLVQRVKKAARA